LLYNKSKINYYFIVTGKVLIPQALNQPRKNLIRHNSDAYTNLLEELTIKQKNILLDLAELERVKPFSEEFRQRFDLGNPSSIQSAIIGLDKKEIIERNGEGFYTISDIFFKQWLKMV